MSPDTFNVLAVGGPDRGAVILITAPDLATPVSFKFMSGTVREEKHSGFTKVSCLFINGVYAKAYTLKRGRQPTMIFTFLAITPVLVHVN